MRILVLGGTQFLGRHVVEAALERGHELTLFNRGQTRPDLFPDVEKLHGDRDGDLGAVAGRDFDAVVDTSGYVPRIVRETIDALGDVGHYTFVSTMSVYTVEARSQGEEGAVAPLPEDTEEVRFDTYGPLKALCEDVVRERFPNAFVPRPGLIVGPCDPTGRFTFWPKRFADGGRVLAPAPREAPVQVVDVRDLAAWIVESAESKLAGTYNAVCPTFSMEHVLETCRAVADPGAEIVWVEPAFLTEREVGPWMELPLWIGDDEEDVDFMRAPVGKALDAGLRIRLLEETVRDTLAWLQSDEAPSEFPAGLAREKEQAVLDAWLSKE
jgi:2'-hydroxyisoflavone reductase